MAQKKLKGKSTSKDKDGQHRKETKEERKARLQRQQEAREQCLKILPYILGAAIVMLLAFTLYVRSVPVKQPKKNLNATAFTADMGQTPYDAVPPDVAEATSSSAEAVKASTTDEKAASSTSQEAATDSATIEL